MLRPLLPTAVQEGALVSFCPLSGGGGTRPMMKWLTCASYQGLACFSSTMATGEREAGGRVSLSPIAVDLHATTAIEAPRLSPRQARQGAFPPATEAVRAVGGVQGELTLGGFIRHRVPLPGGLDSRLLSTRRRHVINNTSSVGLDSRLLSMRSRPKKQPHHNRSATTPTTAKGGSS